MMMMIIIIFKATEVQSPAKVKGLFLYPLCPDRLWGPPSLLSNGYWGSFPGGKERPKREADHSFLSIAEVENEQEIYLLSTQAPS
jgi:hypothetical protein